MSQNRIVITGTISSGKSTVSKILRDKGFFVISADEVQKKLLEKNKKNYNAIKNTPVFRSVFDENGNLDKSKLSKIIFSEEEKRNLLNKITHQNIYDEMEEEYKISKKNTVFFEIPLFNPNNINFEYDEVWLVKSNKNIQLQRLMKRDNISYDYSLKKLQSQGNENINYDVLIKNDDNIENLKNQIYKLLKEKNYETY
ncbi:MAG: dephospho-CoA kinase [Peptoniphilaceae bacterium]|nr:dephospho-CoA kinase [Peptoniphilaceae bacterium]